MSLKAVRALENEISELHAKNKKLSSALEDAITGLEWWMSTYPEGVGK